MLLGKCLFEKYGKILKNFVNHMCAYLLVLGLKKTFLFN